jgi:hypothetical protein
LFYSGQSPFENYGRSNSQQLNLDWVCLGLNSDLWKVYTVLSPETTRIRLSSTFSSSGPSTSMVSSSPCFAPRLKIDKMLLPAAFLPNLLITVTLWLLRLANRTKSAAGLACRPTSGPTVQVLLAISERPHPSSCPLQRLLPKAQGVQRPHSCP